jgi:anthranilate synthase component 2
MILIIDNYDSFVYNLYQYIGEVESDVIVYRNDKITIDEIKKLQPKKIILSPGPGTPVDSGICIDIVKNFYKTVPILGVCLGHQVIGHCFGADVIRADEPVHGKTSVINHNGKDLFEGLEDEVTVTRYHSLIVDEKNLDKDIEITARTKEDGIVMGLKHKNYKLYGLQFHPESIYTQDGKKMIKNFLSV